MARSPLAAGALAMLVACAGAPRPGAEPPPMVMEQPEDESLGDLINAALAADARLELANPLYAEGAITVANGERRQMPPRYAGLAPGGVVAVTSSRIEVRQGVAWAYVEYRWVSTAEGSAREGLASFVLVPAAAGGAGWRILHAHSSAAPAG